MITLNLQRTPHPPQALAASPINPSKLQDLTLHHCEFEMSQFGIDLSAIFDENRVLPGVILCEKQKFIGMLSRRRFLEMMSRRYGPELFLRRPIRMLYEFAQAQVLILSGETEITQAVEISLQRSPELLYEPIVVKLDEETYRLVDIHHLLLAHAQLHELTTQLLDEQTQAKLFQTEKMASLGEMIAGVAHEILNPVNFIWGNVEYLNNYSQDLIEVLQLYETEFPGASPKIEELKAAIEFDFLLQDLPQILASMKLGAERLRKIIAGLRNFSHMDEAVKRSLDIHDCLDNTLLVLNSRIKNLVTVVKNYGDIPEIPSFSGQISQVFTNLIGNAIDALTEFAATNSDPDWQPRIEITTAVFHHALNEDGLSAGVLIQIADNGPGIPPDIQAKVFETFFTTKPVGKGTGLGLAISRQIIVEKHGGKLSFQSEPGQTIFKVQLPLTAA